jgi:hypothetical protein
LAYVYNGNMANTLETGFERTAAEHTDYYHQLQDQAHTLIESGQATDLVQLHDLKEQQPKLRLASSQDAQLLSQKIRDLAQLGDLPPTVLALVADDYQLNTPRLREAVLFSTFQLVMREPNYASPVRIVDTIKHFGWQDHELIDYLNRNGGDFERLDERLVDSEIEVGTNFEQLLYFVDKDVLAKRLLPQFFDRVMAEIEHRIITEPGLAQVFVHERKEDIFSEEGVMDPVLRDCWEVALSLPAGAEALVGLVEVTKQLNQQISSTAKNDALPVVSPQFERWYKGLMRQSRFAALAEAFDEIPTGDLEATLSLNETMLSNLPIRELELVEDESTALETLLEEWSAGELPFVVRWVKDAVAEWRERTVENNQTLAAADRSWIMDEAVNAPQLASFTDQVIKAVLEYAVKQSEGDLAATRQVLSSREHLESVINEALRRVTQVQAIDIPIYEKLYHEMDEVRQSGEALEVYLGRDGIYAMIGREAERVTNLLMRRQLPPEERKRLTQTGELRIHRPRYHYLVFTRSIMTGESDPDKQRYVAQEGVTLESNPYFYDTGYNGSIPADIMRIMGLKEDEIDQRIKMLSANKPERRLRSLRQNVANHLTQAIEDNAKTQDVVVGLDYDQATGEYHPVTHPTSPAERLAFELVKIAISGHFSLREAQRLYNS